ncbi:MAG: DUF6754 domain-containing protein [Chloroflexota bacterium]|nr:DUF6754 domain-containing protein [Chloroflexota bacterium]
MPSLIHAIFFTVDVVALLTLFVSALMFIVFTIRAKGGASIPLRPIGVYEQMRRLVSHAAESGQSLHISAGSGCIGAEATPQAVMGLTAVDYLARRSAEYAYPMMSTAGSPTVFATTHGILQQAEGARGEAGGVGVRFYGPDPFAYAAGTYDTLQEKQPLAHIALGQFGAEGLWISEATNMRDGLRLGGTSDPSSAMLMWLSLDEAVIGEELYAAGAYLHHPSHLGSLATQDYLRAVLIFSIILGVVVASLGYWG